MTEPQVLLGLAIHNHQPVGNFPSVFELAYRQSYLPFLEALERHPAVRLSLHYSGPVLDWLVAHQPDFLHRLSALVARGQVEMMLGAYYEPILPAIPDPDKIGQVGMMQDFLKTHLRAEARGFWLAERVWEPTLPKPLAQAGVEWTLVDDTHFLLSGLEDKQLLGYYMVEEEGYAVKVFPSLKQLRYLIPWRSVNEVMAFLQEHATPQGTAIAVMGDDGEKFGLWPRTYRHCWEQGWMEQLFSAIEENSGWLKILPLGEYAQRFPPLGRAYLPTASYDEMMEWALPPLRSRELAQLRQEMNTAGREDIARYLRGGFWRNFLSKYPEADNLHKKMLRVHRKVYQALALGQGDAGREELWQGQCNCPYWHGVFGGLYLNDVRSANYHHLIRAENRADALLHGVGSWLEVEAADFDLDGEPELLVEGDAQCLYLDPGRGGGIFQWDLRRHGHNLQGTVARRLESYHLMLTPAAAGAEQVHTIHDAISMKEGAPPAQLPYDPYPRWSLLEHLLPAQTTLAEFAAASYRELCPLPAQPYQARWQRESQGLRLHLSREAKAQLGRRTFPVTVVKELLFPQGAEGLEVSYRVSLPAPAPGPVLFVSEWNLNLLGGRNPWAYYVLPGVELKERGLDSTGELAQISRLSLVNEPLNLRVTLNLSTPARIWRFPVESFSNSEAGVERVYQGTCLTLVYPMLPGEELSVTLRWQVADAAPTAEPTP